MGALKVRTSTGPDVWTVVNRGVDFATAVETITGTSTAKAVTPAGYVANLPYYDVETYGVIGADGTMNAATINAAIAAVRALESPTVSGAIIVLPAREIPIASTITFLQSACQLVGAGPDTVLRWTGSAGVPMVNVQDSARVRIADLTILGNASTPPSDGIYFETPTIPTVGTNEYCIVERVNIGRRYDTEAPAGAPLQYGIRFGGAAIGNNDTWRIDNCLIADCTTAGIRVNNEQAIWGLISNVTLQTCGTGISLEGSTTCINVNFNRSSVADWFVNDCRVFIYGYNSEHAEQLWEQQNDSTLMIFGGQAQLAAEMSGNTYYAVSTVTTGYSLMLQGFRVLDQSATGAILRITASSSDTTAAYVYIRGCNLPSGDSDAGYDIDAFAAGTPLHVDIQQGTYWRRQVAAALNTAGSFHLPTIKDPLQPTGTVGATLPRWAPSSFLTPISGTLYLFGVDLAAGTVIANITFVSSAASVTPTNHWFGLFDASFLALRLTADATTAAWAASTAKTLALTSAYTIPTDGRYYFSVMQTAATPATLISSVALSSTAFLAISPNIAPVCNAGLTTPPGLPFTATPATTNNRIVYAYAT